MGINSIVFNFGTTNFVVLNCSNCIDWLLNGIQIIHRLSIGNGTLIIFRPGQRSPFNSRETKSERDSAGPKPQCRIIAVCGL